MSSRITKYLDIDSSYRDRNKFPNPGQFDIIVSQRGTQNINSSIDPISCQTPFVVFTPSDDLNSLLNASLLTTIDIVNTQSSIIVCFPSGQNVNRTPNYYRGIGVTLVTTVPSVTETTTVSGWFYVSTVGATDCFRVLLRRNVIIDLANPGLVIEFKPQVNYNFGYAHIPTGIITSQEYKNYFIYNDIRDESVEIITYDGPIALATFNPPVGWLLTEQVSVREQLPSETGILQGGSSTNVLILPGTSSGIDNFYKGSFIRLINPGAPNNNEIRYITNYVGGTNSLTVNPGFPDITAGDMYQILQFTSDSYNPISYVGTRIFQETCYDVQLTNLTLPNVNLSRGGVSASYPYFFVELYNIDTSNSGNYNIMYSNNPNTTRIQFKVPVTDMSPPSLDSFLTLDKSYMIQTMPLNPSKNYRFGVYLPDGSPYVIDIEDSKSPEKPERLLQVSATFSLKRRN